MINNDKVDPTDKIHIEFMEYLGKNLDTSMGRVAVFAEDLTNIVIENYEELEHGQE